MKADFQVLIVQNKSSGTELIRRLSSICGHTSIITTKNLKKILLKAITYDIVIIGKKVHTSCDRLELALQIFKLTDKHPLIFIDTEYAGLIRFPREELESNIQNDGLWLLIKNL